MKSVLFVIMLLISAYPSWAQDPFAQSGSAPSEQMATADSAGFLPVDQAYQSLLSWDDDTLLLQWTITSGYYLYKERFAISAELNGDALSPSIRFEPGKIKDDPYFGRTEVFYYNTNLSISGLPKDQPFVLTVRSQGCADAGLCYPPQIQHYQYKPQSHEFVQADATGSTATAPAKVISTEQNSAPSLAWVITFAILGGAILNLMPCVFPVLSLKVLSFSQAEDGKTSSHGVIYSLGVIISFIVVAAVLIGLQQGTWSQRQFLYRRTGHTGRQPLYSTLYGNRRGLRRHPAPGHRVTGVCQLGRWHGPARFAAQSISRLAEGFTQARCMDGTFAPVAGVSLARLGHLATLGIRSPTGRQQHGDPAYCMVAYRLCPLALEAGQQR